MNTKLNNTQNWLDLARRAGWSVSELAKFCEVSARTLERHFFKEMGKTPKKWLIEQRQKRARELLCYGYSVKVVASEVGYMHSSSFSREFKKLSGHSPSSTAKMPTKMSVQLQRIA
jgi:transcriptional regulator GlxA family with amidase domain